jgi:pimeloyl-ACP methyl ester carboxylesterase
MSALLWTVAVIVSLLVAGYIYENVQEARDRRRYPAPGTRVRVGGRQLHLLCQGDGEGPTVVIEQGIACPAIVWQGVQSAIARFARVCTYDRPGFQWSDAAAPGRSLEERVADLHAVLQGAAVPTPYLLVGHSLGGLFVRRFAARYPDLVAGFVLVDSPDEPVVFRSALAGFYAQGIRMQQILGIAARFGLLRLVGRRLPMLMLPDDPVGYALCVRPGHAAAAADDFRAVLNASEAMRQAQQPGCLGDRPTVVIAHGVPFPAMAAVMEEGWGEGLERVCALSNDSELVVARNSGHLVYMDEPTLVVESVRRVHTAVRDRAPLSGREARRVQE